MFFLGRLEEVSRLELLGSKELSDLSALGEAEVTLLGSVEVFVLFDAHGGVAVEQLAVQLHEVVESFRAHLKLN